MSSGGLFGSVANTIFFAAVWTAIGMVVDRLGITFNSTIQVMPTFQDAVNGFSTVQVLYGSLAFIALIVIWINYFMGESSQTTGEV